MNSVGDLLPKVPFEKPRDVHSWVGTIFIVFGILSVIYGFSQNKIYLTGFGLLLLFVGLGYLRIVQMQLRNALTQPFNYIEEPYSIFPPELTYSTYLDVHWRAKVYKSIRNEIEDYWIDPNPYCYILKNGKRCQGILEWDIHQWSRRLFLTCLGCNKVVETEHFRVRDAQESAIIDLKSSLTSDQIEGELKALNLI